MLTDEKPYDCTNDVLDHRARVAFWLKFLTSDVLEYRAKHHDESKLCDPEKAIFDEYTPKLKQYEFGSEAYKQALAGMKTGLQHHYNANPHHPEHFADGIDGMNIWDLVEMLADWMAAASVKNAPMNLEYLKKRFNISDQLLSIIKNTLWSADYSMIDNQIPEQFSQRSNFLDYRVEHD